MKDSNEFSLLRQKRFAPFFWTQFLGAFNDNVYKNALILFITFNVAAESSLPTNTLVNLCAGLFILPFFLFSATAGQVADKFEKSRLIRRIKLAEILIMLCAAVAFYLKSVPMLIGVLFLMGTQSAFFGPVKYGILPQQLREEELVGGNGLVEMATFLAILLGTLLGGLLINSEQGVLIVSMLIIALAILGWLTSRGIPEVDAADSELVFNWNLFSQTIKTLQFTAENRIVFTSILGISWFWFFGATYLTQVPNYTLLVLAGNEQVVTLLLASFSIGIAIGSLACQFLSGEHIEMGIVPLGLLGLTLFGVDLYFASSLSPAGELLGAVGFLSHLASWRVLLDLMMLGVFGGIFIVPLYAVVQHRSEPTHRSRIIAGNNILNALFMVVSAGAAIGLFALGLSIGELLLVVALMNLVVMAGLMFFVPEFLSRFVVWVSSRCFNVRRVS